MLMGAGERESGRAGKRASGGLNPFCKKGLGIPKTFRGSLYMMQKNRERPIGEVHGFIAKGGTRYGAAFPCGSR